LVTDAGSRVIERLRMAIDETVSAIADGTKSLSYTISKTAGTHAIGGRPILGRRAIGRSEIIGWSITTPVGHYL
jgi:hypothetical protein